MVLVPTRKSQKRRRASPRGADAMLQLRVSLVALLDAGDRRRARDLDVDRVAVEPEVGPGGDVERRPPSGRRSGWPCARRRRQVVRAAVELAGSRCAAVVHGMRQPGRVAPRWCRRRPAGCRWRRSRTARRAAGWCRAGGRTARPTTAGMRKVITRNVVPSTHEVTVRPGRGAAAVERLDDRGAWCSWPRRAPPTRSAVVPSACSQSVLRGHSPA